MTPLASMDNKFIQGREAEQSSPSQGVGLPKPDNNNLPIEVHADNAPIPCPRTVTYMSFSCFVSLFLSCLDLTGQAGSLAAADWAVTLQMARLCIIAITSRAAGVDG